MPTVIIKIIRMPRAALREIKEWISAVLRNAPGRIGYYLRNYYISTLLDGRPRGLTVGSGIFISGYGNIYIGNNSSFGRMCSLHATHGKLTIGEGLSANYGVWISSDFGEIKIGKNVLIGPYTVLRAANHTFQAGEQTKSLGHTYGEIIIGDNVWIGANVSILSGAIIGDNCVIAAGAVVNKAIPSNSLAGGVPAKVIRKIEGETCK